MKHKTLLFTLAATLALGLAGCGKNESATTTADETATRNAETAKIEAAKAAETAKAEAAKVEAAKVEAANAEAARAEAAKVDASKADTAKVEAAKTADNDKTQGLIDKVKSLIAEGKFTDASSVLQQLAGQSLSSDQAKIVDGLKDQIQKSLVAKAAGNAAGSVGNLLKR